MAALVSVLVALPAAATSENCETVLGDLSPVPLTQVPGADALSTDCVPEEEVAELAVSPEPSGSGFSALATCQKDLFIDTSTLFGGGFQDRETGDETDVHDGWDGNNARLFIQVNRPVHGRTQVYQLRGRGRWVSITNLDTTSAVVFDMSLPWTFKARVETSAGVHGGPVGLVVPTTDADSSVDWQVDFEEDGPSGLFEIRQTDGRTSSHAQFNPVDADWADPDTSGTATRNGYGIPAGATRDYVWNIHMEADVLVDADGAGLGTAMFDAKNSDKRLGVSQIKLTLTSNHCWN